MRREGGRQTEPDGRYADDAMALFMSELSKTGTWPVDYDVKMFGGGDQFPDHAGNMFSVPDNNILVGRQLLQQLGFTIKAEHLGGTGHRNVIFDVWSGKVWIKHVSRHQSIRNHA
ncbi:MAG: hypothetical protein ACXV7F_11535 [Methylomonas sp.]